MTSLFQAPPPGSPDRKTRFQVQVVVQEVCDDGSVPPSELCWAQFGDEVDRSGIFDFFNRIRDGMCLVYAGNSGPLAVELEGVGPNKIAVIKVIRLWTRYGLKEAKDLAESAYVPVMSFDDPRLAADAARSLEKEGAKVRVRPLRSVDRDRRSAALPAIAHVTVPPALPVVP